VGQFTGLADIAKGFFMMNIADMPADINGWLHFRASPQMTRE
jgi:hypothetical protein